MYAIEESTGKCLIATSKLNLKVGFSCYELVSHEYGSNECIFYLHSADTLSPGTVLLFELREMAKECNNRPVAWAFFPPHRSVQLREKCQCLELQLFKWRRESYLVQKQAELYIYNNTTATIPPAYVQFLLHRKRKYKSCLQLTITHSSTIPGPSSDQTATPTLEREVKVPIITSSIKEDPWTGLKRQPSERCRVPTTRLGVMSSGYGAFQPLWTFLCLG